MTPLPDGTETALSFPYAGQFFDRGGAVYNVMHPDFGAKGDGATDDGPAWNLAVAATPTAGGIILVPSGAYVLTTAFSFAAKTGILLLLLPGVVLTGTALPAPTGTNSIVDLRSNGVATLANDATPSVAGGHLFETGGTTTITDFDDGLLGQELEILSAHAITITDGSNILLNGSVNFVMAAGDSLILRMFNDQVWEEVSRKTNTPRVVTFTSADATPSVAGADKFISNATGVTITDFDDGVAGQEITIISGGATVYDTTGTNLSGSSTDITTAAGDTTRWICEDGTTWRLLGYVDISVDNSAGA